MVLMKHIAHPINTRMASGMESMASEEALEVSVPQVEASVDATLSQSLEDSDEL
jgi:hypothetical protein